MFPNVQKNTKLMFQQTNHQILSRVIDLDYLPEELSFIEQSLDTLFTQVMLKNFQKYTSNSGDIIDFYAQLAIHDDASLEIPGTAGMRLILHDGGSSSSTIAQVSVKTELKLLKFLRQWNINSFDFSFPGFFKLICESSGLVEQRLLDKAISLYTIDGEVETFVTHINNQYSHVLSSSLQVYGNDYDEKLDNLYEDLTNNQEFNNQGIDVYQIVFSTIIEQTSAGVEEGLDEFFRGYYFDKPVDKLRQMITPGIIATINFSPAMEVPDNVLQPANGGSNKTRLLFGQVNFKYSTEKDFGFSDDLSVSLNEPSKIAGTDFTIDFNTAKVDLSDNSTLPEISAAGYKKDFKGVFIQSATIGLPPFLIPDGTPPEIKGENLIIGTGGFSGKLTLDACPVTNKCELAA